MVGEFLLALVEYDTGKGKQGDECHDTIFRIGDILINSERED